MYQNIGFEGNPPLKIDTIQQILDTPYKDFKNKQINTETLITKGNPDLTYESNNRQSPVHNDIIGIDSQIINQCSYIHLN